MWPAGCRATATSRSTTRAGPGYPLRRDPARPVRARGPRPAEPQFRIEPAAACHRDDGIGPHRDRPSPARGYIRDPRLIEIAFGDWEGSTIALLHQNDPVRISQREHDKWHFLPPGGESYEMCADRMRSWYGSLNGDVVATAHGGTCRGLMACLGIAKPAAAPPIDIIQGEVYVFQGDKPTRYA